MAENFDQLTMVRRPYSATPLADGSTLVYSQDSETVFPLNESAAVIWDLCDGNRTGAQIASQMAEIYDAPLEQLTADVDRFLFELRNLDLLYIPVAA